jgi:hypothetical protein
MYSMLLVYVCILVLFLFRKKFSGLKLAVNIFTVIGVVCTSLFIVSMYMKSRAKFYIVKKEIIECTTENVDFTFKIGGNELKNTSLNLEVITREWEPVCVRKTTKRRDGTLWVPEAEKYEYYLKRCGDLSDLDFIIIMDTTGSMQGKVIIAPWSSIIEIILKSKIERYLESYSGKQIEVEIIDNQKGGKR